MHAARRIPSGLALVALLLLPLPVRSQAESPESLAGRARGILEKHCAACHGPGKPVKGEVAVLDYPLLADRREVIVAGHSAQSLLIDLVADGSMPPGSRPKLNPAEVQTLRDWIDAGAFPFDCGDEYVTRLVLADARKLDRTSRTAARYLSLNHLLAGRQARAALDQERAALAKAVSYLAKGNAAGLTPVDPSKTVYRVDLHELGWDARPFEVVTIVDDEEKPQGRSTFNLFDLVLLEYPLGSIPEDAALRRQLVQEYLNDARPVRPVPFVRADWFIRSATQPPLAADLLSLLGKRPGPGFRPPSAPADKLPPPRGIAIFPLDAITVRNYAPKPASLDVLFTTVDHNTEKEKRIFLPGDKMAIAIEANRNVHVEIVWSFMGGEMQVTELDDPFIKGGERHIFRGKKGKAYVIEPGAGEDRMTLFASEQPLPPGKVLRSRKKIYRVVHPFYELGPDGRFVNGTFDPARVVKKTITIETRDPPKKDR